MLLSELFKVPEIQAYNKIRTQAKIYKDNSIRVYVATEPYYKLKDGMELRNPTTTSRTPRGTSINRDQNIERSLRRTKQFVSDLAKNNDFDLFATFTFKDDRHDLEKCRTKMSNWLKQTQKRKGKFEYLIIPELHKDGALHFHALLSNFSGFLEPATNPKTNQPLKRKGRQVFNIKNYRLGFTDVEVIESRDKVANYIRKYITKDMPTFLNRKRYWYSSGLSLPKKVDNPHWFNPDAPQTPSYSLNVAQGTIFDYLPDSSPLNRHTRPESPTDL
jgi:hypothetical protein